MATAYYEGRVQAPPAGTGKIYMSVNEDSGHVAGNLVVGARPQHALTGFSGSYAQGLLTANGRNRRTAPDGTVWDLEVAVRGVVVNDARGQVMEGEIAAWVGVPDAARESPEAMAAAAKEWTFTAPLEKGSPKLTIPEEFTFGPENGAPIEPPPPDTIEKAKGLLDRIPDTVKGGTILAGLGYTGYRIYKWWAQK